MVGLTTTQGMLEGPSLDPKGEVKPLRIPLFYVTLNSSETPEEMNWAAYTDQTLPDYDDPYLYLYDGFYEEGMTWGEWLASEYNSVDYMNPIYDVETGFFIPSQSPYIVADSNIIIPPGYGASSIVLCGYSSSLNPTASNIGPYSTTLFALSLGNSIIETYEDIGAASNTPYCSEYYSLISEETIPLRMIFVQMVLVPLP